MKANSSTIKIGGEVLYPQKNAAAALGITVRTLENWRAQRTGPAWVKLGHRIYYRHAALGDWIRSNESNPVAEAVQ